MKNGYEYYYFFGLDIPLEKYNLGVIKQPRIVDFINKDVQIEGFYSPFVMNDCIIGQAKDKEEVRKSKENIGSLTFLIFTCYQSSRVDVITSLINALKFLYDTEDVSITDSLCLKVDDFIVDNNNFDTLSDVVLEMFKIDKSKFDFSKKEEEVDPITARFEHFRKIHRERNKKKKKDVNFLDSLNYLVHSNEGCMDYNRVLNMTMFQVNNSLNTLGHKTNYEVMLQYKLSPKFDVKDEVKVWNIENIVKSSMINKDV